MESSRLVFQERTVRKKKFGECQLVILIRVNPLELFDVRIGLVNRNRSDIHLGNRGDLAQCHGQKKQRQKTTHRDTRGPVQLWLLLYFEADGIPD